MRRLPADGGGIPGSVAWSVRGETPGGPTSQHLAGRPQQLSMPEDDWYRVTSLPGTPHDAALQGIPAAHPARRESPGKSDPSAS